MYSTKHWINGNCNVRVEKGQHKLIGGEIEAREALET